RPALPWGFLHSSLLQGENRRQIAHQLDVVAVAGIHVRHQTHLGNQPAKRLARMKLDLLSTAA
uniref:hypothetical protein n=1 Tax=Falsirhodobacter xinxiangensis TaxID=2530049 RepID=UPI001C6FD020